MAALPVPVHARQLDTYLLDVGLSEHAGVTRTTRRPDAAALDHVRHAVDWDPEPDGDGADRGDWWRGSGTCHAASGVRWRPACPVSDTRESTAGRLLVAARFASN